MMNLSNYVGLRLLVHDGNCGECVAGREIGIFTDFCRHPSGWFQAHQTRLDLFVVLALTFPDPHRRCSSGFPTEKLTRGRKMIKSEREEMTSAPSGWSQMK